jgi:hypothetical protein
MICHLQKLWAKEIFGVQLLGQVRPVNDGDFADENRRVEKPRDVAERQHAQPGGVVAVDELGRRQGERGAVGAALSARAVEVFEGDGEGAGEHEQTQEVGDEPEVGRRRVAVVRNDVVVEDAGLHQVHHQQQGAVHHVHHAPPLKAAQRWRYQVLCKLMPTHNFTRLFAFVLLKTVKLLLCIFLSYQTAWTPQHSIIFLTAVCSGEHLTWCAREYKRKVLNL